MSNVFPVVDTDDLAAAIKEFEAALPGWWFSLGACSVSRHASCGPDVKGVDAALLADRQFDEGFDCDDADGSLASSLRNVMRQALAARGVLRR